MALVNRLFSVNITPGMMPPIVHVSEYDVGRAYTVSILDEQGNTFTIPSGTTASIEGTLNGSVGFTQSATVSNNQVSFTLSESMTAYSGKAWCKIKLTQNSQPIQTCAFILAVDRAGVEADTILGGSGFQEQINEGIAEYFDNDPPFFELPSGGQSGQALVSDGQGGGAWGNKPFQLPSGGQAGQALISDGANSAIWGEAGIPSAVKTALLACFQNAAWISDNGQSYYDALYSALYPDTPAPPTPSRLPPEYQEVEYIENTGTAYIATQLQMQLGYKVKAKAYRASKPNGTQVVVGGQAALRACAFLAYSASNENRIGSFYSTTINAFTNLSGLYNGFVEAETVFRANQISVSLKNSTATETATANGSPAVSSLALFSTGNTQEPLYFIGRIASVSVEDGNGNAVGNLIPCYRKSDSVVGMYDTANSLFYTSDSSDVFSKGGDVA